MNCPNCEYKVSEDDRVCHSCKVKLWSNKILNTWDEMEIIIES